MKTQRNDTCPCLSGKKYKKCCLPTKELMTSIVNTTDNDILDKKFIAAARPEVDAECDRILELLERTGDIATAQKSADQLLSMYPDDATVLFLQGACCIKKENFTLAKLYFERSVEIFPYFSTTHYNLAILYRKELCIPEMLVSLKRVVRLEGKQGELGKLAQQELDEFEAMTKKSAGLSVDEYLENHKLFDLAFESLKDQRYDEAILLFKQVIAQNPNHEKSYGNMGLAYSRLGKNKLALEYLDKAIAIEPTYEPAIQNREIIAQLAEGEKLEGFMQEIC